MSKRLKGLLIFCAVLFALVLAPVIFSGVFINLAQMKNIHGELDLQSYDLAVYWNSASRHTRLSAASAYARAGDAVRVIELLLPEIRVNGLRVESANMVLPALAVESRWDEIAKMTDDANNAYWTKNALLSTVYARLQTGRLDGVTIEWLGPALNLDDSSGESSLLNERLHSRNFWESADGTNVRDALHWRISAMSLTSTAERTADFEEAAKIQMAARLLGGKPEKLRLGDELVADFVKKTPDGCTLSYEFGCVIDEWLPIKMASGNPWNRAVFVIGLDDLNGVPNTPIALPIDGLAARIDGLLIENQSDLEPARAGVTYSNTIELEPNKTMLVTFLYRTHNAVSTLGPAVYLADDNVSFGGYMFLPFTNDQWKRVAMIIPNTTDEIIEIKPLFALFGQGSMWIDDISVRELQYINGSSLVLSNTLISIEAVER